MKIRKSTAWPILTSDGFAFRVFMRVLLLLPITRQRTCSLLSASVRRDTSTGAGSCLRTPLFHH